MSLRGVGGERLHDELVDRRLRGTGVRRVGHVAVVAVAAELLELPGPVDHLPQRVGGEAADLRPLLLQVGVDRLRARGGRVVVADRAAGGGLVPGVLGEQRDRAEHVVGVEVRVVRPGEVEHHRMGVGGGHLRHVVREEPGQVRGPVLGVRLEEVVDEGEVPAGEGLSVRPVPVLEVDGQPLVAVRVVERGEQALLLVHLRLGAVAGVDEVRPQRLGEVGVPAVLVGRRDQREDEVGYRRHLRDREGAALLHRALRRGGVLAVGDRAVVAPAPAAGARHGGHRQGRRHRDTSGTSDHAHACHRPPHSCGTTSGPMATWHTAGARQASA